MAIVKKITDEYNGLEANYHKIFQISRTDEGFVELIIRSYKSKSYRDNEKALHEEGAEWNAKKDEIERIMALPVEERTPEEQALRDEGYAFYKMVSKIGNFYLYDSSIAINEEYLEDDYSIEKCYEILKTSGIYEGAEDV